MMKPLPKKGEWSVQVFDLNREDLRKARGKADTETDNMVHRGEGGSSRLIVWLLEWRGGYRAAGITTWVGARYA
jgi:hypothetical protein